MSGKSKLPHSPVSQTKVVQREQILSYQGRLPPPNMLREFKDIDPALLDKIVDMAERSLKIEEIKLAESVSSQKEQLARQRFESEKALELEAREIKHSANFDLRSQLFVFLLVVIVLGLILFLTLNGSKDVAFALIGSTFFFAVFPVIKALSSRRK